MVVRTVETGSAVIPKSRGTAEVRQPDFSACLAASWRNGAVQPENLPEEPAHRGKIDVKGIHWDDQLLASFAGGREGVPVSTEKPIHWESTGDHQLTPDEIADLRSRYDLSNLSPQDYYNLMSDLTQMNVLSAEDIHGMHFKTFEMHPNRLICLPDGYNTYTKKPSMTSGNIISAILSELEELGHNRTLTQTREFLLMNPSLAQGGALEKYWDTIGERETFLQRLFNIFSSIQGPSV